MINLFTRLYNFYQEVRHEARNITWPTKNYLTRSTTLIIGIVSIASLVCLLVDYTVHYIITSILKYYL